MARPTKRPKTIKSWSYSTLNVFEQCALRSKFSKIDRIFEPPSSAMDRGSRIHGLCEQYILDARESAVEIPKELWEWKDELDELVHDGALPEVELAATRDLVKCAWDDWDNCWVRAKVDALLVLEELHLIDFKTGRYRDTHIDQMSVYAWVGMELYPHETVNVEFWYLDEPKGDHNPWHHQFTRTEDYESLREEMIRRGEAMTTETEFAPNPGSACRWCFFAKNKGGQCEFNSEGR